MIAALFVQTNGAYFGLPGVDPWDEARDARKYAGPHPVVAHPPCSRWCALAYVIRARYGYGIGEDAGCFASALASPARHRGPMQNRKRKNAADGMRPVQGDSERCNKLTRLLSPEAGLSPIARKVLIHRLEGKTEIQVLRCMGISRKRYLEALASFKRVSFGDETAEVDPNEALVSDSHQAEILEEFAGVAYRRR
jgi:hypothetical protein